MPAAIPNQPAARGRNVASKPLSSSVKPKSTSSATGSSMSKPSRTPSVSSAASSKSSVAGSTSSKAGKQPSTSQSSARGSEPDNGFKVTKLSSTTVTLNTTWKPRPPAPQPQPRASTPAIAQSTPTSDPLQVAAQIYPWNHMTSTLDECFKSAETAATSDLESRATKLAADESEVADQRDRLEAERAISFFDELGSDALAKEAPAIMQLFHSHGDSCARVEIEALKLANKTSSISEDEEPLKVYNDLLHDLEQLQDQATSLQNSILKLTEETPTNTSNSDAEVDSSVGRAQINGVFSSCLPVLRARVANLSLAQELIDTALENVTLGLRMESMGIV